MNRLAAIARETYTQLGRGLLVLGSVAALAAVTSAPVRAEVKPDPGNLTSHTGHVGQSLDFAVAAEGSNATMSAATGTFDTLWATDLDIDLGIVVQTDEAGQQVAWVYYWKDEWLLWGTGIVTDDVLSGQLDEAVGGGTFTFKLTEDGKGFDAEATSLWEWSEISFKGEYVGWE